MLSDFARFDVLFVKAQWGKSAAKPPRRAAAINQIRLTF
jgi:hypothetical protein